MLSLKNWFTAPLLGVALSLTTWLSPALPVAASAGQLPAADVGLPGTDPLWQGEYFRDQNLGSTTNGFPVLTRGEVLNYDWMDGSPDPSQVPADHFSARWGRNYQLASGYYRLKLTADDGVRVYVDNKRVIDRWIDQAPTTYMTDLNLAAGHHTVMVEYYENTGSAVIKFDMQKLSDGGTQPGKTEVIVDETSRGFIWSGSPAGRLDDLRGYAGHMNYMRNQKTAYLFGARWTPSLPKAGWYQAFAYVPGVHATSRSVRYRTFHNGQRSDTVINQNAISNQWVSLGTHYYNGRNDGGEYIFVASNTGEADYSRDIGIDAIKWVFVPGQP